MIRLARTADTIRVEIADQGTGMTPQRLAEVQTQGTGVGVRGMRERVRQFDGQMEIASNNIGTTVSISFPIARTASIESRNAVGAS
jgi:signal transduction histidine kinase